MLHFARGVREWATPALKDTAFIEKGVLTPEEFVAAGDELVSKFPTWQWEAGDSSRRASYLAPETKSITAVTVAPPLHRFTFLVRPLFLSGRTEEGVVTLYGANHGSSQ